jgi:hypothetical protein
MHRFVWPLRYAQPDALRPKNDSTTDPARKGVWAPPGEYTVELTVDGKTLRRRLTVAPDPRVELDAAAYLQEFELARKVEAVQARIAAAKSAADEVQKQLTARRAEADKALGKTLDRFQEDLVTVSGSAPIANTYNKWSIPPKTIENLSWLSTALKDLMKVVDGADAAPSPDARAGYAKLAPMADASIAAWREFLATDLAALNQKLETAGLQPITPIAQTGN